jgi:hypothetical protein
MKKTQRNHESEGIAHVVNSTYKTIGKITEAAFFVHA